MLMKSSESSPNSTASEGLPNSTRESENRKLSTYQYFAVYGNDTTDGLCELIEQMEVPQWKCRRCSHD